VLSEQDNKESPDETVEELEALIFQEKTKLDKARQKSKLEKEAQGVTKANLSTVVQART